jgi:hypothetical protein
MLSDPRKQRIAENVEDYLEYVRQLKEHGIDDPVAAAIVCLTEAIPTDMATEHIGEALGQLNEYMNGIVQPSGGSIDGWSHLRTCDIGRD